MPPVSADSDHCSEVSGCWIPDPSHVDLLFETEKDFMPRPEFIHVVDLTAREDSINWILRAHMHYGFKPVTAYLAVNYFDRILSSHTLQLRNRWPLQLLGVACLSLAAKMEEIVVPKLVDLQIFEPKFLFDPKTVQRMELLILAHLDWRLRSVTPFDYIDYYASKISLSDPKLCVMAASDLILKTCRVIAFSSFLPSTISAAAVLSVSATGVHFPDTVYKRADKGMVKTCHQLMAQYLLDTCHTSDGPNLDVDPVHPSPIGILDVAASSSYSSRSCITSIEDGLLSKRPRLSK